MSKTRRIIKIILNSILLVLLVAILALLIYAQVYPPKTQALDNNQSTSNVADLGSGVYCGKNLLDIWDATYNDSFVQFANNSFRFFNMANYDASQVNFALNNKITAGKTYTLSFTAQNLSNTAISIHTGYDYTYNGWHHIDTVNSSQTKNITLTFTALSNNFGARILLSVLAGTQAIISNMQIEQGSTATAYEPYFSNRDTFYQKFDYDMFNYLDNGIIVGGFIYDYNYKYSLTIPSNFLDSFDITNKLSLFVMADDGVNAEYLLYSRRSPGITFTVDIVNQSHISKNSTIVLFLEGNYPNITSDMISGLVFKAIPVDGINDAYDSIYNDGYNAGLSYGSGDGYNRGYAVGRSDGMAVGGSSWNNLFPSIFGGIAGFFRNSLDIPILGTNLLTIVGTVGAIFIALSVIRLIIR